MSPPVIARRWPVDRPISPTVLNAYRHCPQRVRLDYLDHVPKPFAFRPALTKGNATHLALKRIADARARNRPTIDNAEVERMARMLLPRQEFPSENEWMAHLNDVSRWVERGRAYIERESIQSWVLVERPLKRPWKLFRHDPPYTVTARPDVIVLHAKRDNTPLVEIVDYKTGQQRFDEMPPLMLRLVARELLERLVEDVEAAQVRFSYLWLDSGEQDVVDLTPEYIEYYWGEVERDMRRLASESEWPATPSRGCHYCPFYRNACPEEAPPEDAITGS